MVVLIIMIVIAVMVVVGVVRFFAGVLQLFKFLPCKFDRSGPFGVEVGRQTGQVEWPGRFRCAAG